MPPKEPPKNRNPIAKVVTRIRHKVIPNKKKDKLNEIESRISKSAMLNLRDSEDRRLD